MQEIAAALDSVVVAGGLKSATAQQPPAADGMPVRLQASAALATGLRRCLAPDVFLAPLADKFARLALQLVARFRARARQAGIGEVTIAGRNVRFAPVHLSDSRGVRLKRLHPKAVVKDAVGTVLVPRPMTAGLGGKPISGIPLLEWARGVIDSVLDPKEQ